MEVFGNVAMIVIFVAGMVPMIGAIIDYSRENKRLDQERKSRKDQPL